MSTSPIIISVESFFMTLLCLPPVLLKLQISHPSTFMLKSSVGDKGLSCKNHGNDSSSERSRRWQKLAGMTGKTMGFSFSLS